jgi:hypothetical protein
MGNEGGVGPNLKAMREAVVALDTVALPFCDTDRSQSDIYDDSYLSPTRLAAEAKKAGDKEVYRFDMSPIAGNEWFGNDYHPNIYQDEKMAVELTAYLRSLMNWF